MKPASRQSNGFLSDNARSIIAIGQNLRAAHFAGASTSFIRFATYVQSRHRGRLGNGGLAFTESRFGTAPLGKLDNAIIEKVTQGTRQAVWSAGRKFFDTAPLYGLDLAKTRLNV